MDSIKIRVVNGMGRTRYVSQIRTYCNDNPVDSMFYTPEAVGGYKGISPGIELCGHMVFSKHGDYNGRTLIVNSSGQIQSIIGGDTYYDSISKLLFTSWESDDSGFAVYDLENDSLLMAKVGVRLRPESFHKVNDEFYALCYDDSKRLNVVRQFYLKEIEYGRSKNRGVKINNSNKLQRITIYPEDCIE